MNKNIFKIIVLLSVMGVPLLVLANIFLLPIINKSLASVNYEVIKKNQLIAINEDLSKGLKGVDVNNNGIRDDIDRLIKDEFSQTEEVKKAAEQEARAIQAMMVATNTTDVYTAVHQMGRSSACIYQVLPNKTREHQKIRNAITKKIEALTANTRERIHKYMDSNRMAGGGYFSDPLEPVCD